MLKKLFLTLCGASLLSACVLNTDVVSQDYRDSFYSDHLVRFSIANGALATVVIGKPFKKSTSQEGKDVIKGLFLPAHFGQIPLQAIDQSQRPQGRLVFLFDPSQPVHSRKLCQGQPVSSKSTGNRMEVQAAFCYGSELASEAVLTLPRPNSADNPIYRQGMENLLAIMLPLRANRHGDCPRQTGC